MQGSILQLASTRNMDQLKAMQLNPSMQDSLVSGVTATSVPPSTVHAPNPAEGNTATMQSSPGSQAAAAPAWPKMASHDTVPIVASDMWASMFMSASAQEAEPTKQHLSKRIQPTSHSILSMDVDGIAVVSAAATSPGHPHQKPSSALAATKPQPYPALPAAYHTRQEAPTSPCTSVPVTDSGDEVQAALACFSQEELDKFLELGIPMEQVKQLLLSALHGPRPPVMQIMRSTLLISSPTLSRSSTPQQHGGLLAAAAHAGTSAQTSLQPCMHSGLQGHAKGQASPALQPTAPTSAIDAGDDAMEQDGSPWLRNDACSLTGVTEAELAVAECLQSLKKPTVMAAQQAPQQLTPSCPLAVEPRVPADIAVMAANLLKAWERSTCSAKPRDRLPGAASQRPWSAAAVQAYEALVDAATQAPGATPNGTPQSRRRGRDAAADCFCGAEQEYSRPTSCGPRICGTEGAGLQGLHAHTAPPGAMASSLAGGFEDFAPLPFDHFMPAAHCSTVYPQAVFKQNGSMSAPPAKWPAAGRGSTARAVGSKCAGAMCCKTGAAGQTAGHGGRTTAARLQQESQVQQPSSGKSVFAATDRWMREVNDIIPKDMQDIIRADWQATEGLQQLDVVCKGVPAKFFVDPETQRCMIRTEDGHVMTPNVFETECGAANSKAWLQSIMARDYLLLTRGHGESGYTTRHICLGHFTRIANISTSRK